MKLLSLFVVTLSSLPAWPEDPPSPTKMENGGSSGIAAMYRPAVDKILASALAENDAYKKLEELCLFVGHRLSGSPQLDKAIDWAVAAMKKDGQENARRERVLVPHWVRGNESATMLEPRVAGLSMLGLGGSIATPPDGISAPVLVVKDKEELDQRAEEARGKIVLFNNVMPPYDPEKGSGYGKAVQFRGKGAILAAEKGAVACLVRSVTAKSLRSPHTGAMRYEDGVTKIPAAAITVEDADMIARLQARGVPVVVNLKMEAKTLDDAVSANVVAELRGREKPDEVVVIGGHIDSWDVGHGAHDDGAGCVMAMEAINVLRKLNMVPRRTIRVVLFTNEENGLAGGKTYAKDHDGELKNHVAAIESDSGGFRPDGYSVECEDKRRQEIAFQQIKEIGTLLGSIGPMEFNQGHSGADISPMKPAGVMLMGHSVEGSTYFDYHHTHADTIDKVIPRELSENVAVLASVAYIIADMPERFGMEPKSDLSTK
jgi:carboxypeptidase Q